MVRVGTATLVVLDALVLTLGRPQWREIAAGVAAPHRWVDEIGADQAAADLSGAALWLVAAWFALALAISAASAAPGVLGEAAERVSRHLAPAAIRRLVTASAAGAAGAGILFAPANALAAPTPTTASAVPTPITASAVPAPASVPVGPVWPSDGGAGRGPVDPPAWPTNTTAVPVSRDVVVQPGDSLWVIAAHRLGAAATDSQIAAEWPRWYAANRATVGPDPSLIRPGELLRPPAPEGK